MIRFSIATCLLVLCSANTSAEDKILHEFEKVQISKEYFAEGAGFGDFNKDGKRDLVCGPNWFEGPEFKKKHLFYKGKAFPNDRGYSDNFFSFVYDISGDGWDDILVVGLPGTPGHWYENPKDAANQNWKKRLAFSNVDNEAPIFDDINGDKLPDLICTFKGRLGFATFDRDNLDRPWNWNPISEQGKWQRFSHGLGIGDVNNDGRKDYLVPEGWWEQPNDLTAEKVWKSNAQRLAGGGAQIYSVDVDGDGDNDIVSSNAAHAYGLHWFENSKKGDAIELKKHQIMGAKKSDNPFGVSFSQLHAIDCKDIDGDGRIDIVAGKCYWAHNGADPGARDPSVIYWFQNTERDGKVEFVPRMIDDNSGVGRQVQIVDMNNDGLLDIIAANKKGVFVFLHKKRKVSEKEWKEALPKRIESVKGK